MRGSLRGLRDRGRGFARLNPQTDVAVRNNSDDAAVVIHYGHTPDFMFAHCFDCTRHVVGSAARDNCSGHYVEDLRVVWIARFSDYLGRQISIRDDPDQAASSILTDDGN